MPEMSVQVVLIYGTGGVVSYDAMLVENGYLVAIAHASTKKQATKEVWAEHRRRCIEDDAVLQRIGD